MGFQPSIIVWPSHRKVNIDGSWKGRWAQHRAAKQAISPTLPDTEKAPRLGLKNSQRPTTDRLLGTLIIANAKRSEGKKLLIRCGMSESLGEGLDVPQSLVAIEDEVRRVQLPESGCPRKEKARTSGGPEKVAVLIGAAIDEGDYDRLLKKFFNASAAALVESFEVGPNF